MMNKIERHRDVHEILKRIEQFPVTAILGPRQCGKTTLARDLAYQHYFDLENPRDLIRLEHPQIALEELTGVIVIDEVQRQPELFPLLRYLVDTRPAQKYVILGSASRDLIRQSSESLAGRIAYYQLSGFRLHDIGREHLKQLWLRGGLPDAYTPETEEASLLWRENYIATFLERDLPQLGIVIPAHTLRRFWTMLCHYHGQVMNYSEVAKSFGISDMTVRRYLDILTGTFMVRLLQPWHQNIGKRQVKRPKLYLRDSGLLHALLRIEAFDQLTAHPKLGASWEGFALECAVQSIGLGDEAFSFWGTHSGAELDIFWQRGGQNWGIECKYADAPRLTQSMQSAVTDLKLAHLWVIYPGHDRYPLASHATVLPLRDIPETWQYP